jgi:hypothetical protein
MMKKLLSGPLLCAGILLAQSAAEKPAAAEPGKYYRIGITVRELDGGKILNSRSYATTVGGEHPGKSEIRAQDHVTVSATGQREYQVGFSADCFNAAEIGNLLALSTAVGVDSLSPADSENAPPVIHHNSWSAAVVVPLAKPTVIFSSDEPGSKRQMQVELTATPIK